MKISVLFLMLLLTISTIPVIASAEENNEVPKKITFNASVSGEFWLGYSEGGVNYEGVGEGDTRIRGRESEFSEWPLPWSPSTWVWRSESMNARGSIEVSWTDVLDGDNHYLFATFEQGPSTVGLFSQENEWFFVTIPGQPDSALRFRGIHISDSGIQRISGGIGVFIAPATMWISDTEGDLCIVALLEEDPQSGQIKEQYWFYWSSDGIPQFQMGNIPDPAVELPAAQKFRWKMNTVY